MQPGRTLDQVIASLGSIYDPAAQNIQQQRSLIPQQLQTDESALQGQQTQAFDSILQGARRRGTGVAFGGIPLGEQAKYNSTTFMPALANLRGQYATKDLSLQDALLSLNRDRATQAQSTFENERNFYEQQRQFNEQQALAKRQAAAYSPTFGGPTKPQADTSAASSITPDQQKVYNDVQGLLSKDPARIQREYEAIRKSAGFGNAYDRTKQALIEQLYPAALKFGKPVTISGGGTPTNVFNTPKQSLIPFASGGSGSIRI